MTSPSWMYGWLKLRLSSFLYDLTIAAAAGKDSKTMTRCPWDGSKYEYSQNIKVRSLGREQAISSMSTSAIENGHVGRDAKEPRVQRIIGREQ